MPRILTRKHNFGIGALLAALLVTGFFIAERGRQTAAGESKGQPEWLTDVPKALAKAKAENKVVMLDFTGSDWCAPCKVLDKTVFSTREFGDYAAKNLVLVQLDYPEDKPQPAELKAANKELAKKYAIEGYPTVILMDADGKELSKQGPPKATTPAEFIAELEKARKKG